MRRRLTVSMVLMVVGALLLAGGVGFVLSVHEARLETRRELVREANGLAISVRTEAALASDRADPAIALRAVLRALKSPLRLEGSAVIGVLPGGEVFDPARPRVPLQLPKDLSLADLDPTALISDATSHTTVSGNRGSLVYAVAPYRAEIEIGDVPRDAVQAVVLIRRAPAGLGDTWPWLLLAAGIIIAVAALVADRLGRRIVAPLRAAEAVTGRIAAGDLEARVAHPPDADSELASLADSVNTMAASLSRARVSEREFLLSVSHELRTPLTSIRGYAEAIEDGAANPAPAATVIVAEAGRLERLVGDLLDLAKLQSREFGLRMEPLDAGAVARTAAGGFAPAARDLGLALDVAGLDAVVPPAAVMAVADGDRLGQVVANLVENALKFASGHVSVGTGLGGLAPVVWVDDDGPGIPPEALGRVFERLFTTSDRQGRNVGSGLGLAIVAELVAAMGGTVRAESPIFEGRGTRVVVTLRAP